MRDGFICWGDGEVRGGCYWGAGVFLGVLVLGGVDIECWASVSYRKPSIHFMCSQNMMGEKLVSGTCFHRLSASAESDGV